MKIVSFVLAIVSLVLVLVLSAVTYDTNSRLAHLAESQGNSLASNATKAQGAMDKINDTVKALQQNMAQLAADNKQNSAAIDDMKKRINRLIDLIK